MQHEPCRLLGHADGVSDLVRANAVLAVGERPDRDQPLFESDWRVLEDGSDLRRELAFGVNALALPLGLVFEEHNVIPATGRALHHAIRPALRNHVSDAVLWVSEVLNRGLKGSWVHDVITCLTTWIQVMVRPLFGSPAAR
jgi:hypothetical protein